jgi:hypothetical protein
MGAGFGLFLPLKIGTAEGRIPYQPSLKVRQGPTKSGRGGPKGWEMGIIEIEGLKARSMMIR